MEARIHIADPSPPYCAACHQAKPQEPHVDLGASFDGPMLPATTNVVGMVGHSVDDMIVCSTCIADAAKLIGLEDAAKLRTELDMERTRNDELHDRISTQRAAVSDALETVRKAAAGDTGQVASSPNSALPGVGSAPKRTTRRPRVKA